MCRKTKTKVIIPENYNRHKLPNEPIRTRRKYLWPVPSTGKRVRASRDWFKFYFWVVKKVEQDFLTNHSAK